MNTAVHRARRTHSNWYWELGPASNNEGRNCSVPPPVQLGPPSIQKMELWLEVWRVPGIRPPWTQIHQGRMWMTLTWTQPLDTVCHAQTQTRCLYGLLTRSTGRGYGLPVDWAKAVSGWKLSYKRINDSHQNVWGHDHESVRTEWKHTLSEDHNSFEMQKMTVRTDQLLCIAEATGSKIYTREPVATYHGRVKTLVFSLK